MRTEQNRPTSIEREIFPKMAEDKQLYRLVLQGFWIDIGQPRDYLKGMSLYLEYQRSRQGDSRELVNESEFVTAEWAKGNVLKVVERRVWDVA